MDDDTVWQRSLLTVGTVQAWLREAEVRSRAKTLLWLASLLTKDWHPSPQERRWLRAQAEEEKP